MTSAPLRPFPWWIYWAALALILLVALLPAISVVVAGGIADANGCRLHEGFQNPCLVGGNDIGDTLYVMGVLGWFMLATLPLGGGALIVFVVVFIIHYLAWRNAQDAQ